MKTSHVEQLVGILTKNFDIAIRKGSISIRFNHDKKWWEVFGLIDQRPGWKVGKLADFEDVNDAVEFERMMDR